MNITVDIGNSQIFFGIFKNDKKILSFKKSSKTIFSSDELGIFLTNILKHNKIKIDFLACAIASVVPSLTNIIFQSIKTYLNPTHIFILGPGVKTGINIRYKNPHEVGADRIANCIAAKHLYGENKNYIIVDIGTATTFDILNNKNEYLGGLIIPGPYIQATSLSSSTAKLSQVEISKPKELIIDNTVSAISCGIYYSNLFGIKGVTEMIKERFFNNQQTLVIGTGGGINIFENEKIFDIINQDLILFGLNHMITINIQEER